jgi:hypothetical protein
MVRAERIVEVLLRNGFSTFDISLLFRASRLSQLFPDGHAAAPEFLNGRHFLPGALAMLGTMRAVSPPVGGALICAGLSLLKHAQPHGNEAACGLREDLIRLGFSGTQADRIDDSIRSGGILLILSCLGPHEANMATLLLKSSGAGSVTASGEYAAPPARTRVA